MIGGAGAGEDEFAAADGGVAGVGVCTGEGLGAGAHFGDTGCIVDTIGDYAREGAVVVGIAEGDQCRAACCPVVTDHDTGSAESPHLEGARCATIVGPADCEVIAGGSLQLHGAIELNVRVLQSGGVAADPDAAAGTFDRTGDAVNDQGSGEGGVVVAKVHPAAGVGRIDRHRGGRVRSRAFESIVQVESCYACITCVIDDDTGPGIDGGATALGA